MVWPTESANQVLLQWTPTTTGSRKATSTSTSTSTTTKTTTCKLIYDETHHYLRIVDAATNDVLDTMDGDDVLGASISIELKDETTTTFADPRVVSSSPSAAPENPTLDSIPTDTQAQATLTIFVYPRKPPPSSSVVSSIYRTCRSALYFKTDPDVAPTPSYERPSTFDRYGARYAHGRTLILSPVEDLTHVRVLVRAIQTLARMTHHSHRHGTTTASSIIPPAMHGNDTTDPPRHYVIVCNPTSGPNKNATKIAQEQVIPMLQQANIETTLCVTTHPGHAVELCHLQSEESTPPPPSHDDDDDDAITAPHRPTLQRLPSDIRYFNGIVVMGGDGTMHEVIQGIRSRPDAAQILSTIPIGIIGCGTANGLATSLTYTSYSYFRTSDDDDTTATSRPYDFTYQGITDDIFAIAKGYTIQADLSTYSILESTEPPAIKEYTSFLTFTYGLIAEVDIESERIHWMGSSRFDVWAAVRVLFLRQYPIKLSYTTETTTSHTTLSISDPVPSSWTTIEDKITLFWASQVSHAGSKVYNSPPSKTADGKITIMLIRGKVSQVQLARILLGLESGTHVALKGVEWISCTAYRLEPIVGKNIRRTFNNIDGEKVEYGPIQGTVLPKAIKYFISPP